jgi:hypothetical protein
VGTLADKADNTMASTIRLWHRILVDRIAESPWLRGKSGEDASWAHYERHARAAASAAARHARTAAAAKARAADWQERGKAVHERLSQHYDWPERMLPRWQAAISRLLGTHESTDGPAHGPDERQGK